MAALSVRCYTWAFSSCGKWRLLSSCGAWASHCSGFFCCRAWALECASSVVWNTGLVALWHVGSSWTRDQPYVPCIGRDILNHWTTREVLVFHFKFHLFELSTYFSSTFLNLLYTEPTIYCLWISIVLEPLPPFTNKVLLKHIHLPLSTHYMWLLLLYKSRVEKLQLSTTTTKSRRLQITKDFIWGLKNSNSGDRTG